MQQIEDFRAEVADLAFTLARLRPEQWSITTQFKGYTVADLLRHLHQGDHFGLVSAEAPGNFDALLADRRRRGLSRLEDARQLYGHLHGAALLDIWQTTANRLCDALARLGPDARLKWAGPDMGLKMFATARQMEVWSHGQDIYDILGLDREASDRLENIAVIGVRTFGWTYVNRGETVPASPPRVRLAAPSGALWSWNDGSSAGSVEGSAVDFCMVVTQVRNVADTGLRVAGETARDWMSKAQCFAGPPNDPPPPGTRFRVPRVAP